MTTRTLTNQEFADLPTGHAPCPPTDTPHHTWTYTLTLATAITTAATAAVWLIQLGAHESSGTAPTTTPATTPAATTYVHGDLPDCAARLDLPCIAHH